PTSLACRVSSMASFVEFEPAPAITGTRPRAVSTQSATTRICSLWLRVGDSPVVPTGTNPSVPSEICHSTRRLNAPSSSSPFLKGVMSAVMEPLNRSTTAMPSPTESLTALYDLSALGPMAQRIHPNYARRGYVSGKAAEIGAMLYSLLSQMGLVEWE